MSDLNFSLTSGIKPMVRETANMNNDGGGGNLGYMQQRKKDKKDRQHKLDESIFFAKKDSFIGSFQEVEFVDEGLVSNFVGNLFNTIKKWLGI